MQNKTHTKETKRNLPRQVTQCRGSVFLIKNHPVSPRLHMLLIDDDYSFCRIMEKVALAKNVAVTSCQSLSDISNLALTDTYDVAVIDYYLDGAKIDLRGSSVARHLAHTPSILISQTQSCRMDNAIWPGNIRKFMTKGNGPAAIIDEALRLEKGWLKNRRSQ